MLVIDRIEFKVVNQTLEIRHFDYGNAVILQGLPNALDEAVQVGHMSEHIVGVDNVGAVTFANKLPCQLEGEERLQRRHSDRHGCLGGTCCWVYPKNWNTSFHVILQKIAVVACELDNQ